MGLFPTHQLAQAAREAAERFSLPPDWHEGRPNRVGFAIDESYTKDVDDAISLSSTAIGGVLHVSIADVGTFLADEPAIARLAQRRAWTIYANNHVTVPMIPLPISEDKLSLLDGVERPALTFHIPIDKSGAVGPPTITRDVLRATHIPYKSVEKLLTQDNEQAIALQGLERAARLLFQSRHENSVTPQAQDSSAEDEGNALPRGYGIGRLIVRESMIAANTAAPQFMQAHNIPALYRNRIVPPELLPEITDPQLRSQLLGPFAQAVYSTTPDRQVPGLPIYMHVTSPLRRFSDFANHANLAAFLEGRAYPYSEDRLEHIAQRLRMLALKEAAAAASNKRPKREGQGQSNEPLIAPYRKTDYLLSKFADGSAGPGDIATALFDAVGSAEQIADAKIAAAHFAAANVHHARPAIDIALSRNHVSLRVMPPATDTDKPTLALEDRQGNTYAYPSSRNPLRLSIACAHLLGRICDVSVDPVIPENRTREALILRDGNAYLYKLTKEGRIAVKARSYEEADGNVCVEYVVTVNGEQHMARATMPSKTQARRTAAADIITRLDLINTLPAVGLNASTTETSKPKDPKSNPIVILQIRQQKAGGEQAVYTFSTSTEDKITTCTATLTDIDGKQYQTTVRAARKAAAKRLAAATLLARLPLRASYKKRK